MRRYWNIYKIFFKTSISGMLAYRANMFARFTLEAGWLTLQIIVIETIYTHTDSFAGWPRGELYMMYGLFLITWKLHNMLFRNNLITIPDIVTDGNLDIILTKPVSSLFYVSLRQFNIKAAINTLYPIGVITYGINLSGLTLTVPNVLITVWLVICGVIIIYGSLLMLETLAFWFMRMSNAYELFSHVFRVSRFPIEIYGKFKYVLYTVIPLALLGWFPARAFMGELEMRWVAYSTAMALLFLFLGIRFWFFGLKRYSSASS